MTLKTYRVGVVGLGAVGSRMIGNMQAHDRFDPVVGFDSSAAACSALAEQAPTTSTVGDFESLLARDDIDVLYVSTPPASHAPYVRQGIAKGWTIFCEKPLGVDIADSEGLTREMQASGLGQGVNFVYSGAPAAHRARHLIDEGVIGDIVGAELDVRLSQWPRAFQAQATWLSKRLEGGFTREMISHHAYLTLMLLGAPRLSGQALAHFEPDGGAESLMLAVWETDQGRVTVSGSVGGNRQDTVSYRILGTKGCLRFDNWYTLLLETTAGVEDVLDEAERAPTAAYQGQLDQLAHQMDTNEQRLATFEDALVVQRLIEAMVA